MLGWSSTFFARKARAPDPEVAGERWRELWLERLEKSPPFVEAWLAHQRRDDYWKQGSVCEDYGAIECAVYAVGGWADAYRDAVLRLLENLSCPRKGLIGPWGHNYPEEGVPGPAIGFLQECLRWWDYWLKGEETGIMDEPMLRAWMPERAEPAAYLAERPGRWVAEESWPTPRIGTQSHPLAFPAAEIRGVEASALDGGEWCPFGRGPELPTDQRAADGLSLSWTSEPLEQRLEILGVPEVELDLAADRSSALVAVRLCDVAPDGRSALVTYGVLNLSHRTSRERPEPLVPGDRYAVTLRLGAIAHAFPPENRLRVAVSPTYWPMVWPSPERVVLSVFGGALRLPVRPPRSEDERLPPFEPPAAAPPLVYEVLRPMTIERETSRDLARGLSELRWTIDYGGLRRIARSGVEFEVHGPNTLTILEGDPLSAFVRCERIDRFARGEWETRVETVSTMSADRESFHVTNALDAYEGDVRVFAKTWTLTVPRDHV
jgi:predicted acyl esterase